mgnify:CR=1 FL=1
MNKLKQYNLSDLYEMSSGISSSKDQAGHGAPFVSFGTVFNNYFLPETLPDLMDTSAQEQEVYSVKKGDILITRTSETIDELAMSSVAIKDYPQATYSGFTKRLRPITEGIAYDKYMAFYLRSEWFRKVITNNAFMTLRASFNEDIFSFLKIYLPEYEEQVKIGDFLYLIEKRINNNEQAIRKIEEITKTIFDYWFIQYNYPNPDGNPYQSSGGELEWNELLKRKIPKGWRVERLEKCIENINTGLNPRDNFKLGDGPIKYVTVKNLTTEGILNFNGCDVIDNAAKKVVHQRSDVSKGDILFASIAPLGRCYLVQKYPDTWDINESVFSIRANTDLVSPEYLYSYFMSELFIKAATSSSTGSIFKGIRINTLYDIITAIPEEKVIKAYDEKVSELLQVKDVKFWENEKLKSIRDWLVPMFTNGQAYLK